MSAGQPQDIGVPKSRTISTTSPLSGGGNLSADRTLSVEAGNDDEILGTTGGSAAWRTLNAVFDSLFGTTRATVIRRIASGWTGTTFNNSNQVLGYNGSDAVPRSLSAVLDNAVGSTRGSIVYRGASGWAVAPPGTATYVWTSNGAGADPTYQAVPTPAASGAWEVIQSQLVTSNTTTVTFSGLDGNSDGVYLLDYTWLSGGDTVVTSLYLRPNGATTNLRSTRLLWTNTTVTGTQDTSNIQLAVGQSGSVATTNAGRAVIQARASDNSVARIRAVQSWWSQIQATPVVQGHQSNGIWNETSTNITSIDLVSSKASDILNGSRFTLYRQVR
jgi:hypothetical protein